MQVSGTRGEAADWFPVLGSRCCGSDAGEGLGGLSSLRVSVGTGTRNHVSSPERSPHHPGLPHRTSHLWLLRTPSPLPPTPTKPAAYLSPAHALPTLPPLGLILFPEGRWEWFSLI